MYYYPSHRIQNQFCTHSALFAPPREHSNSTTRPFRTLPGIINTPGSRAAMWRKCLAEGQQYRATTVGIETGLSACESSGHTTVPRQWVSYLFLTPSSIVASFLLWGGGGRQAPQMYREKNHVHVSYNCASERAPRKHYIYVSDLKIHLHT